MLAAVPPLDQGELRPRFAGHQWQPLRAPPRRGETEPSAAAVPGAGQDAVESALGLLSIHSAGLTLSSRQSVTSHQQAEPADVETDELLNVPQSVSSEERDGSTVDSANRATSRKTEQNRRAQQRYRRRKKEMFEEQQRLNVELSMQLEQLMLEHSNTQARASFLEEMIEDKSRVVHGHVLASSLEACTSGFVDALADLVQVLRLGHQDARLLRQLLQQATADLLTGQQSGLAFLREEMVVQVGRCLLQLEQQGLPEAHSRICELICAYVKMIQRAGTAHPEALLTYLALPVQPATGQGVLEALQAMQLQPEQEQQLLEAHSALAAAARQLAVGRDSLVATLQAVQPSTACQAQSVFSTVQAQTASTSWQRSVAEERRNAVNFYSLAALVLDPLQHARALVASYPAAVDMMAVCSMLAGHRLITPARRSSLVDEAMQREAGAKGSLHMAATGMLPAASSPAHRPSLPSSHLLQDAMPSASSAGSLLSPQRVGSLDPSALSAALLQSGSARSLASLPTPHALIPPLASSASPQSLGTPRSMGMLSGLASPSQTRGASWS